MYGLDPDTWQQDIRKVYEKIVSRIIKISKGTYNDGKFIRELSPEDFDLIVQINPETYDNLDELKLRIEELKATKINIFDTENLKEAKELLEKIQKKTLDPLEKAFKSYSSGQ